MRIFVNSPYNIELDKFNITTDLYVPEYITADDVFDNMFKKLVFLSQDIDIISSDGPALWFQKMYFMRSCGLDQYKIFESACKDLIHRSIFIYVRGEGDFASKHRSIYMQFYAAFNADHIVTDKSEVNNILTELII